MGLRPQRRDPGSGIYFQARPADYIQRCYEPRRSTLERALEQCRDDLALEQDKHDKGGHKNQDCGGAQ